MAYTFNGTASFLSTATTPVVAAPLTIACWFYPDNITTDGIIVAVGDTGGSFSRFSVMLRGTVAGDPLEAGAFQPGGTGGQARTAVAYQQQVWQHAAGVFTSDTSRTVYLNGGNAATNTASSPPSSLDYIAVGARFNSSWGNFFAGRVADVGIWNVALNASEITSLSKGLPCDMVRPMSLVFYSPLIRQAIDLRSGLAIANNASATVSNHPRIYA